LNTLFEKGEFVGLPAWIENCVYSKPETFTLLSDFKTSFETSILASGEDLYLLKNLSAKRFGDRMQRSFDQVFGQKIEVARYSKRDRKGRGYGIQGIACTDRSEKVSDPKTLFFPVKRGEKFS
jgi:hypothetical protein